MRISSVSALLSARRGSVSHERGSAAPSAEAYAEALAGVEQALPAVAPWRRAQLLAAVAALAARSPAKVGTPMLSRSVTGIVTCTPISVA